MSPREVTSHEMWNTLAASLPRAHVFQSWEWGEFKSQYGWVSRRLVWERAGRPVAAASVLKRSVPSGGFSARLSLLYVPRGPLLDWSDAPLVESVLTDLEQSARAESAVFLKIDPEVTVGGPPLTALRLQEPPRAPARVTADPTWSRDEAQQVAQVIPRILLERGWRYSPEQVQFRNTLQLDLSSHEAALLARMKPKTRYNVRLASRRGVAVRRAKPADFDLLYRMYAETSVRDGFVIRTPEYYRDAWGNFMAAGLAEALIAEVAGEPVAGLVVFRFGGRAWFMYGMSTSAHRERMPNYLLQWEAIRRAKAAGCSVYDFWGAPDKIAESDSMWGVYRFKEGFGGRLVRTLGAWDFPANRPLYWLYTRIMPRVLGLLRVRGKRRTLAGLNRGP